MQTWTEKQDLGNGIFLYKNVIKKEFDVINRLENVLGEIAPQGEPLKDGKIYRWNPAFVVSRNSTKMMGRIYWQRAKLIWCWNIMAISRS
jgi:nitric oxide synthase oxygenase domain/subunit